jgi:hypothetical protein
MKHISYCTYAFVDFIAKVIIVGGCYPDGSTVTFIAGVSKNIWHR